MFFPLLFLPVLQLLSPSLTLFTKHWAVHHLSISFCPYVAGTLCYPSSLSHVQLGLEPSQNLQCLVSGPKEAQVLDVSLQKEVIEIESRRQEVDLFRFREKHSPQSVCHHRGCMWWP